MRTALICVTFLALTAQSVLSNVLTRLEDGSLRLVPVGQNQCSQGASLGNLLDILGRLPSGPCGGSLPNLPGQLPIVRVPGYPRIVRRPAINSGSRVLIQTVRLPSIRPVKPSLPQLPIKQIPQAYPWPQQSCVSATLYCRLVVLRQPPRVPIGVLPWLGGQPGIGLLPGLSGLPQGGARPYYGYNDPSAPEDDSEVLLNKNDDVTANDPADYETNHDNPDTPDYPALEDAPHAQI